MAAEKKDEETESELAIESPAEPEVPAWESELDTYPLRSPSEDPRWAVRTVGCWIAVAVASLIFIVVLLVLGAIYD